MESYKRVMVAPFGRAAVEGESDVDSPVEHLPEGEAAWTSRPLVPASLAAKFDVLGIRVVRGGEVVGDALVSAPVPATALTENTFAEDLARDFRPVEVRRGDVLRFAVRRTGAGPADFFASLFVEIGSAPEAAEPVVALVESASSSEPVPPEGVVTVRATLLAPRDSVWAIDRFVIPGAVGARFAVEQLEVDGQGIFPPDGGAIPGLAFGEKARGNGLVCPPLQPGSTLVVRVKNVDESPRDFVCVFSFYRAQQTLTEAELTTLAPPSGKPEEPQIV